MKETEARDAAPKTLYASGRQFKAGRTSHAIGVANVVLVGVVLAGIALVLNAVFTGTGLQGVSLASRTTVETSYVTATVTRTEFLPPVPDVTASTSSLSAQPSSETPAHNETESSHGDSSDLGEDSEDEIPQWLLDFEIPWGQLENYELGDKLGEGEYAEVFRAVDLRNSKECVVKVLKPTEKYLVKLEIKILQDLVGGPNIVRLVDVARNDMGKSPSIVTEYVNNQYYRDLYATFEDIDVRFYMFQLLAALDYAHRKNIMHRDIKPHNIMIDHESRKLRLIDWGLSDYYHPDSGHSTSVGSRFWRAPEILVDYKWYNPSSDIWSVGCMMAGLVFGKEPFFRGRHNDANQLAKISHILGTEDLFRWLDKYDIELDDDFDDIRGLHDKQTWESQVYWRQRNRAGVDAFDLLSKLLVYDHNERLTASEAMDHQYFDPVRSWASSHPNSTTAWDIQ